MGRGLNLVLERVGGRSSYIYIEFCILCDVTIHEGTSHNTHFFDVISDFGECSKKQGYIC